MERKITASRAQRIFYNNRIMKNILSFVDDGTKKVVKTSFKKTGLKDRKRKLKEVVKHYIVDFGKHQEKIKFRLNEQGNIVVETSVFNISREVLRRFDTVHHKESGEDIELEKEDLYGYLKVLPRSQLYLTNKEGDLLEVSKPIIPYDSQDDGAAREEEEGRKYEMFYEMTDLTHNFSDVDFSNKENLIERQKKMLEIINTSKSQVFYPLEFIGSVNYWTIILCHGGYFACGFFLRDQVVDHKSDHKYVTRKKAGQRQITKDKVKKSKSSSN